MNNHQHDLESTIYLMLATLGYLNEEVIKLSTTLKELKENVSK